MDFDFSAEQKAFQDQVRRALQSACPLSETRRVMEGSEPHSKPAWRALAALGVTAASIPEAYGGLGLGYYELCLAAEEAGRALAPTPLGSSIFLAAEALIASGTDEQRATWLPGMAAGDVIGCFGDVNATGTLPEFRLGMLHGTCSPVADASSADMAIVAARRSNGPPELFLVRLDHPGVRRRVLATVDPSRDIVELTFEAAEAEPLGRSAEDAGLVNVLRQRAAILTAFEQIGGAERALFMARDYALTRKTFGRQIGSYQAIKHKLANVYIKLEIARTHAHYGAWALSTGSADMRAAAAAARVTATEAFSFAAQENIQVHGGVGFTWEADCQLFYRRSRLLALQLGDAMTWKDAVVQELERLNEGRGA